jgi:uncharacterized membrane protein YidH (DUF202 family)
MLMLAAYNLAYVLDTLDNETLVVIVVIAVLMNVIAYARWYRNNR